MPRHTLHASVPRGIPRIPHADTPSVENGPSHRDQCDQCCHGRLDHGGAHGGRHDRHHPHRIRHNFENHALPPHREVHYELLLRAPRPSPGILPGADHRPRQRHQHMESPPQHAHRVGIPPVQPFVPMPRRRERSQGLDGIGAGTAGPRHLDPAIAVDNLLRNTAQFAIPHEVEPRVHTRPASLPRAHPLGAHALPVRDRQTAPREHHGRPRRGVHRRRSRQEHGQHGRQHRAGAAIAQVRVPTPPKQGGTTRGTRSQGGPIAALHGRHLGNGDTPAPRRQIHGGRHVGEPALPVRRGVHADVHPGGTSQELAQRGRRRIQRSQGESPHDPRGEAEPPRSEPLGRRPGGLPRDLLLPPPEVSKVPRLPLQAERGGVRRGRIPIARIPRPSARGRPRLFGGAGGQSDVRRLRYEAAVRERGG
mmetsp:Transcript_29443/g.61427  ORF Transcript_29443/g.61427 Transcript_29443/m.61427 type:complete len:421 (+) Transcript_29443:1308-2570(+)